MAKNSINKITAAQKQIDTAIRLLFREEDSLSIHTLISASYQILKDLSEKQGESKVHNDFKAIIRPGMEKEFWKVFNNAANFFKHADKDAESIIEFDDALNDLYLFIACQYYSSLGYEYTVEMQTFVSLFVVLNPNLITPNATTASHLSKFECKKFRELSRSEQMSLGRELIKVNYSQAANLVNKEMVTRSGP